MGNKDFPFLPDASSTNAHTYEALCHCGTVTYTVTLPEPLESTKVVECNCTICARNGYLLVYPLRSQLIVKSGEDALKSYSFGIKRNLHKFCGKCGSAVFFDPRMAEFGEEPDLLGINVRMFKGVDLKKLQLAPWDGLNKSRFVDSDHLQ